MEHVDKNWGGGVPPNLSPTPPITYQVCKQKFSYQPIFTLTSTELEA